MLMPLATIKMKILRLVSIVKQGVFVAKIQDMAHFHEVAFHGRALQSVAFSLGLYYNTKKYKEDFKHRQGT